MPTEEGKNILCDGSTEEDLITETYENMLEEEQFEKMTSRVILAPRNKEVDRLNELIMDKYNIFYNESIICRLPGDYTEYIGENKLQALNDGQRNPDEDLYPPELLSTLDPSDLPPHVLKLKVNTIVMLLRNIATSKGLCNGTRLLVVDLEPNLIRAKILTGIC